jgi:hypothetical protein
MAEEKRNPPKRAMTPERKALFLEHLAEFGLVTLACRHASPHAPGGSTKLFYQERKKDPEFRQAWEDALAIADDLILKEMHRRGLQGWQEETQWGSVTRYSDKLLEIYGKVKSSRIRNALGSSKVEVTNVTQQPDLGLGSLTPESQELLRQILENEQAKDAADPSES